MTSDPALSALLLAGIALVIYLAAIGISLRLSKQRYAVRLLIGCAALVFGLVFIGIQSFVVASFWHFAAFFGGGVAVTVFTYGAVLKALSLRIFSVIAQSADRSATIAHITDDVVWIAFEERIMLLKQKKLIRRENNEHGSGFVLTPAGILAAARLQRLQDLLNINSRGFYWE